MTKEPLHKVISDWIRNEIKLGRLQIDDKIPSEHELANQFDVSRLTVRRALQTLEQDQLIFRSQGLGAFVKAPMPKKKLLHLHSFDEDLSHAGIKPESVILSQKLEVPPYHVRSILGLDEQKKAFQLIRVRKGDGRVFAYDITWLPVFYGQLIEDKDLRFTSIYSILENEYNIPILKGCHRFDAAIADETLAEFLQVNLNTPLLMIRRASYSTGNKVVYYQERYLRTDRFAYEMQLERDKTVISSQNQINIKDFSPIFEPQWDVFSVD